MLTLLLAPGEKVIISLDVQRGERVPDPQGGINVGA
ncbi:MAG: hypothetical protein RIR33_3042 [Pseudomonadota bacterium]